MNKILATAALAAAFGAAPALAADPAPAPRSAAVGYSDLNLASEAGQRILDARIGRAVREVCGEASDIDVRGRNLVAQCRADTAKAAAAKRRAVLASARPNAGQIASGR